MNKCYCYITCPVTPIEGCKSLNHCRATKNYEVCTCEGDELKCDFFPQVRERALEILRKESLDIELDTIIKELNGLNLHNIYSEELKRLKIVDKLNNIKLFINEKEGIL